MLIVYFESAREARAIGERAITRWEALDSEAHIAHIFPRILGISHLFSGFLVLYGSHETKYDRSMLRTASPSNKLDLTKEEREPVGRTIARRDLAARR